MNFVPRAGGAKALAAVVIFLWSAIGSFAQNAAFLDVIKQRIKEESGAGKYSDEDFDLFCSIRTSPLAERVLFEYGSVFAATRDVRVPLTCIFEAPADVDRFHAKLKTRTELFGTVEIELQEKAMKQLMSAVEEASRLRLSITPLDGSIAGRRSYYDTVRIWNSRFHRALDHWTQRGRIEPEQAQDIRTAPVRQQAEQVMKWEAEGLFFSTDLSKSIFFSVAPPGTSQHLSLLAFDVVEAGNPAVRRILNKYGWFQTIRTDQPHFTFLGVPESELARRGLRNVLVRGNSYWLPALESDRPRIVRPQS